MRLANEAGQDGIIQFLLWEGSGFCYDSDPSNMQLPSVKSSSDKSK
jgi:hypothetical protein